MIDICNIETLIVCNIDSLNIDFSLAEWIVFWQVSVRKIRDASRNWYFGIKERTILTRRFFVRLYFQPHYAKKSRLYISIYSLTISRISVWTEFIQLGHLVHSTLASSPNKRKCDKCGNEFTKCSFARHCRSYNVPGSIRTETRRERLRARKYVTCQHCGDPHSASNLSRHVRTRWRTRRSTRRCNVKILASIVFLGSCIFVSFRCVFAFFFGVLCVCVVFLQFVVVQWRLSPKLLKFLLSFRQKKLRSRKQGSRSSRSLLRWTQGRSS